MKFDLGIVKVIYAGVEVSRKEGKKKLSVICVQVMVQGTRGNEGTERSGVHDKDQWTKDRALGTPQEVLNRSSGLMRIVVFMILFITEGLQIVATNGDGKER